MLMTPNLARTTLRPAASPSTILLVACIATLVASILGAPHARADETTPIERIAFGSCLRQERDVPIFDAINNVKPDVFIFLGDNVYADTTDEAVFLKKYAQLAEKPGFVKLRESSQVLAIWDDHDFGENDAGREFAHVDLAKRIFLDFWGEPLDSQRRSRDGIYDALVFGPPDRRVQIILLDTRTFRDPLELDPTQTRKRYIPTTDTSRSILGETQWAWLAEQLKTEAAVRVIASSIQVLTEEHQFEKWMNFPHERDRLMKLLDNAPPALTLVVSGDRHFAEISRSDSLTGRPIIDITSSSLNASGWGNRNEPNRWRISPFVGDNNFGLIEFDWTARTARLALLGEAGNPLADISVTLTPEARALAPDQPETPSNPNAPMPQAD